MICWWLVESYLTDGIGVASRYFGNFSTLGEWYYFCVEESMQGEIKTTWGKIETNIGKLGNWVEGVLDLHKSGNELEIRFAQVW